MNAPQWWVLLIGGNSATGKTVIARQLARHFQVSLLLADDVRLALQRVTTPAQQPALHYFLGGNSVWQQPPEMLCEALINIGKIVSHALEIIIAHHLAVVEAGPLIVEGDSILPQMVAQDHFDGLKAFSDYEHKLRSIFLLEPKEEVLLKNMKERGRGFQDSPPIEQQTIARTSWLYGQWLQQAAQARGLPVLPVRPQNTIIERILTVITATN